MLFLQSYDLVGCLGSMHTLTTDLQFTQRSQFGYAETFIFDYHSHSYFTITNKNHFCVVITF